MNIINSFKRFSKIANDQAHEPVLRVGGDWPYEVRHLSSQDIPAIIEIQEKGGNGNIVPRDAAFLAQHFESGQTGYGCFHQGELVAQALITNNRKTGVSRMGTVVTLPEACGHGLMTAMVQLWLDACHTDGIPYAEARVRVSNTGKSQKVFADQGLEIAGMGPSPDDPTHEVYLLRKAIPCRFARQHALHDTTAYPAAALV